MIKNVSFGTFAKLIFSAMFLFLAVNLSLNAQTATPNNDMWVTNGTINAIAVDGNYTYIGGYFTYVGPNTGYGAKITTTSTTPNMLFPKVNGIICTAVPDGNGGWYIGGYFTKVGGLSRNHIAQINSDGSVSSWNPDASDPVTTIAISGSDIYVGGDFTTIGGLTRKCIAKLSGTDGSVSSWNPDANSTVTTVAISGSDIYVGGYFTTIGGNMQPSLALFTDRALPVELTTFTASSTTSTSCYVKSQVRKPRYIRNI